jgi:hypothetical protein
VSRVLAEPEGTDLTPSSGPRTASSWGGPTYKRAYEPIWYGWREGVKQQFLSARSGPVGALEDPPARRVAQGLG